MSNYIITKAHLDQLTPEQKEKLREWWTPEKEDKLLLEKSGRVYTVKGVRGSKIMVGSFGVEKEKCLPLLTESVLLHSLANFYYINSTPFIIIDMSDEGQKCWRVTTHDAETLIEALWDNFKAELLA